VPWDNPWHFFCIIEKGEGASIVPALEKGESNENNELRQLQSLSGYEITE
jgi:hypothetical protein